MRQHIFFIHFWELGLVQHPAAPFLHQQLFMVCIGYCVFRQTCFHASRLSRIPKTVGWHSGRFPLNTPFIQSAECFDENLQIITEVHEIPPSVWVVYWCWDDMDMLLLFKIIILTNPACWFVSKKNVFFLFSFLRYRWVLVTLEHGYVCELQEECPFVPNCCVNASMILNELHFFKNQSCFKHIVIFSSFG
jgi:hypothetical protein